MVKNKVQAVRAHRGMLQKELAAACGLGTSTISDIERGTHTPSIEEALLIARALGEDVSKLFYLE